MASTEDILSNTTAADMEILKLYMSAVPTLIPMALEANLPDSDLYKTFLVGTRFTLEELFTLHSSVVDLEKFLQKTKAGVDAEKAPTVMRIAEALSEKNLGMMGALLALMVKAESEPIEKVTCRNVEKSSRFKYV